MHWNLLELDPATATAKDVKRAYAKRLKICRPDRDPEGFRNLHQAYLAALEEVEEVGDHGGAFPVVLPQTVVENPEVATPTAADPVPSAVSGRSTVGQAAVSRAFDRIEAGLADSSNEGIADLMREAEAILYENPGEVELWGRLFAGLIQLHGAHPDLKLKPEAMLFELQNDGCAATLAVIDRLESHGRRVAADSLALSLWDHRARIATPAGGLATARMAEVAAMWGKTLVKPLANFAYQHLGVRIREERMLMIERRTTTGELLHPVPDAWKYFWVCRLEHPYVPYDWTSEKGRAAIEVLRSKEAILWRCYPQLRNLVPGEQAASLPLPNARPRQGGLPGGVPAARPQSRPPRKLAAPVTSRAWEGPSAWQMIVGVGFLIRILFAVSNCSHHHY